MSSASERGTGARNPARARFDLLELPLVGRFLRWRHARLALQLPLLLLAAALVAHGLLGPELAPKNLATLLAWVHYRGALVLVLLLAGNLFCLGCPFLLPRELARRLRPARHLWPRALRNKWLALGLFVAILFAYELFDLWGAPRWTAVLALSYFGGAFVVDALFRHAPFCKWVCPIGQFNFLASTFSPTEIRVKEPSACGACRTKDCIRGRATPEGRHQRGCELALFQPLKVGNLDCTFCLDCVHACPHDNVGFVLRLPGEELLDERPRSGIGRLAHRRDLAAFAVVFTFGALLNAFGMVAPVYAAQRWIAERLGLAHEAPVLAILFAAGLVVAPAMLVGPTAWTAHRWSGTREGLLAMTTRYSFALVPFGFGVWLAHYSFHFFTGLWTFVPVAQLALRDLGWAVLGEPRWGLGGFSEAAVWPLELGFLGLGLLGTLGVVQHYASKDAPEAPWRAGIPWSALAIFLFGIAVWLLAQPMEMRGTFLGG